MFINVLRRGSVALALLVAAGAVFAAGCGDDATSPTQPALPAFQQTAANGGGTGLNTVLGTDTVEAMNLAIQDEYHAEFTYLKVIETFGEVQPFYNILFAEQRHSAAIAQLFTNHGLPVPASNWNLDNAPTFGSLTEACAAGVEAELANIALYNQLLARELPQDVSNVFTNLRAASLEGHLPAFQTCCACTQ
ncbi:MAG: DUF2202 domain-containing protein [Acidobacteriota bacterium]|jgi:hypothetical protein